MHGLNFRQNCKIECKVIVMSDETMVGASDNGRKINVWSDNKYSNALHTAVSVAFSAPSSVQRKNG